MKISDYAKKLGVSYKTVWRMWKAGQLDAYQLPTGTVIVRDTVDETSIKNKVCIYTRVSSSENKSNLESQAERLSSFCTANGYVIQKIVKEIGSGINDNRKQLLKVLCDDSYKILVVEHKDRLTRFGFNYIKVLFEKLNKEILVVNEAVGDKEDLMQDFISIVTSFCARIYGLRRSRRKTEKLILDLKDDKKK